MITTSRLPSVPRRGLLRNYKMVATKTLGNLGQNSTVKAIPVYQKYSYEHDRKSRQTKRGKKANGEGAVHANAIERRDGGSNFEGEVEHITIRSKKGLVKGKGG